MQMSKEVNDVSIKELEALGFNGSFESIKEMQACCSEVKASLLSIQQASDKDNPTPREEREKRDVEAWDDIAMRLSILEKNGFASLNPPHFLLNPCHLYTSQSPT